ncbi:type VII secretion protein EccE [Saccharomonospora xinjiangensis]|uniref:Type VII secretion protein EccE n=1 Tax=Saccharomonospora xinjiangensis XJ-54 TaxID=882086 RepID=I0V125_9PSEU|nr:type VII secretion protein EccE [Saccharomonospora xinjiangensis]EID53828.1 type VII secretion protein EccE [Saccharomonospora xinjiangensis XJ-54]
MFGANFGPVPVTNLVLLELGLAIGLVLIAIDESLLYVAFGVAGVMLILAFLRWGGQWFTQWAGLTARYAFRSHDRVVVPPAPASVEAIAAQDDDTVIGPDDARVSLLRLAVPDLVVAQGRDHEHQEVGFAYHDGIWTAVLLVEPTPALITQAGGAPSLPLSALAPCLEDRGVVLDSIQMTWHCYPGSAALPADSPALASYMEVLGPLPAAARRTTWVSVRLDPKRCPTAVRERGGGVVGAHRALIGALSRVRNAMETHGVPTRPLSPDELLRAGISAAELTGVAGSSTQVRMQERWTGVTTAGIGHASYAITSWPKGKISTTLNALTSVRALSSTVAMSISPSDEENRIGLRGVVRLSARNPRELDAGDQRLTSVSERIGVTLTPLRGRQAAGFAATLPLGGTA